MINEIISMNGYGLYVWSAFSFTLISFAGLYFVIKSQLLKYIHEMPDAIMNDDYEIIEISFPYTEARQISMAQRNVEVLDRNYKDDRVNLKIKGSKERIKQILNDS